MTRPCRFVFLVALFVLVTCHVSLVTEVHAERIKDIAAFEGARENQLIGYGLVLGLNGTGDKGRATLQSIANMLQRMGLTVKPVDIKAKNAASVMVTAKLPPYPKPGARIDALVSTMGDATSIQGGTLLLTPLKGPDGAVYAVAQGPISIGGFSAGGGGTTVVKNHPTAGKVPEGVIIEREPDFAVASSGELRIFLQRPDFATATEVAKKINGSMGEECASTVDPSGVKIRVPAKYAGRVVEFMSIVEGLDVAVDVPARVVINERTGTVVIGEKVRISPVAVAHGSLTVDTKTRFNVSQPSEFGPIGSRTVVVPEKDVATDEQKAYLQEVSGATLGEIVKGLNALGVTSRDLMAILQALKASGALRAELEII